MSKDRHNRNKKIWTIKLVFLVSVYHLNIPDGHRKSGYVLTLDMRAKEEHHGALLKSFWT